MTRIAKPLVALILLSLPVAAQTCITAPDMDAPTKSGLESTALSIYSATASANVASLRATLAPSLNNTAVESAISDNKDDLTGSSGTLRAAFILDATSIPRAQTVSFYCGVMNSSMYTAFQIENLAPGKYAYALVDGKGGKGPVMLSEVLQNVSGQWKLAGFVLKPASLAGHDAYWYLDKARQFKSKSQALNSWLYYQTAWRLLVPVDFLSSPHVEELRTEVQAAHPAELPTRDKPITLATTGKSYQVNDMFATPVGDGLDIVVKFQVPSVADHGQAYEDNMAVIKAVIARYPELREGFAAVVARAVAPNGEDFGTLLAMKDVK